MKHNSNVMINSVFLVILYAVYHFFLSFFNKGIEIEIVMNAVFLTYVLVLYIFGYMNFEDEMFRLRYIFHFFDLLNLFNEISISSLSNSVSLFLPQSSNFLRKLIALSVSQLS